MTRAVVATEYGGTEVLAIIDEPTPDPGQGEVRIAVRGAGVNPIDHKLYSGEFGSDPAKLPMRLGFEVAGEIAAVGDDVEGFAVGDAVIAHAVNGGYADQVVTSVDKLVHKPAGLDWIPAAGLLLTGSTAVHALTAAKVSEGDTVLIHGAGGVGLMAVQLAVARGARALITASPARHDELRELGGEPVTYGDGLLDRVRELAPEGVDAALDLVGTDEALRVSLALVADRSRIVTIANFQGAAAEGITALGGGPGADPGTAIRAAAKFELADLVEAGRLVVTVDRTFPLTDVADAHRHQASGHASGKVVLIP